MADISDRAKRLIAEFEAFDGQAGNALTVYSEGLFYASVCTSLNDREADDMMAARPCGVANGWQRADEPFRDGSPNPSPCPDDPSRRHILYEA